MPNALIELWQANAAGRYVHQSDQHPAPLDPNFTGAGRCLTDADGTYRFTTIKPGAYPWKNHPNAWRPAHIHFSLFGRAFTDRLVTQMYFPGDPLFASDPIFQSIRDPERARAAGLGARLGDDHAGVGARLPLRHRARRPRRHADGALTVRARRRRRPWGRSSRSACDQGAEPLAGPDEPAAIRLGGRVLDGEQQPVPDAMVEIWHPHAGWGRSGTDAGRRVRLRDGPGAARRFSPCWCSRADC